MKAKVDFCLPSESFVELPLRTMAFLLHSFSGRLQLILVLGQSLDPEELSEICCLMQQVATPEVQLQGSVMHS